MPIISLLLAVFASQPGVPTGDLVIQNVVLVSPERESAVSGKAVRISDGRIVEVGESPLTLTGSETVLDGDGRYLAPGLTDSHHHVSFVPGMGAVGLPPAIQHPELVEAYLTQQPRSLLYHGVTQILDPAPLSNWQAFTEAPLHPDMYRCGEVPGLPTGYPLNQRTGLGVEALYSYAIDDAHQAESVISRMADDGAVCVKVYLENGFGAANDWPLMDPETVDAIVQAASQRGMTVVVHANAIDMYQIALDQGAQVMAHGLWNWQWPQGTPPVAETLDRTIEQVSFYMPTLSVMGGLAGHLRPEHLEDAELHIVTPALLIEFYREGGSEWFADQLVFGFDPDMAREDIASFFDSGVHRGQQALAYVHEGGLPVVLASDCPGSPTTFNQPGLCTLREMEAMIDAGLTPVDVFKSGTLNAAALLGLQDDYGRIAPGYVGNLVLMSANPLDSVEAWRQIEFVILRGEVIEREALRAP